MFNKVLRFWKNLLKRHEQKKQVNVHEFRKIITEVTHLSEIAIEIGSEHNQTMERLKKIRRETNKLSRLVENRKFTKIPHSARLELRKSLLTSREQLVEMINNVPTLTNTLQ